jgi:hypothetical protein
MLPETRVKGQKSESDEKVYWTSDFVQIGLN